MWKIIPYSLLQSLLLAAGQLMMKLALNHMSPYQGFWRFIGHELTNWWWLGCGISMGGATVMYVVLYNEEFPAQCGIPLELPEFCVRYAGSHAVPG